MIVVHPALTLRGQIVGTLKALGFSSVHGTDDIADVVRVLSEESDKHPVMWVITTLVAGEKFNALQLGKMLHETRELSQTFWSILLSSEDSYVIPLALEHGLLSWHPLDQFSAVDSIKFEINSLAEFAQRAEYNVDVVALDFARLYLKETRAYEMVLKLTSAMVEILPRSGDCLMAHADALASMGRGDDAKKFATRAVWLERSLHAKLPHLKDSELKPVFTAEEISDLQNSSQSILSVFGISQCIIVDPDSAARNHLRTAMQSLGVNQIAEFEDGQEAWLFIKENHNNSVLISEWKLPKLSGMALLQRMYQAGIHDMPVIVSSAQLNAQDQGLIEELGSAVLLQKPLSIDMLDANIRMAVKEENLPSSYKALMRKVRSLLRQEEIDKARKLWSAGTIEMLVPAIYRKLISSEILFAEGKFEEAYVEALAAANMGASGAHVLNLLGKITFQLGDFDSAISWFEKANEKVAINIERLTDLAAAQMNVNDIAKASDAVAVAEKIDAGNPKVLETKAMLALEKSDPAEAAMLMGQLDDLMNVVAHLNNRAVAMAWSGNHEKGILLYRQALTAAPTNTSNKNRSFIPFVIYNLALAFARKGELKDAESVIEKLDPALFATLDSRLSAKFGAFQKKLKQALKKGLTLSIDTPRTSDIAKIRMQNLARAAVDKETKASNLLKSLKVLGNIDYRALKMVEKQMRFGFKKI